MRKTITGNDLRIKGVSVIRNVLSALPEAFVTVHGGKRY